ncbi:MAG: hypothetical protein AB7I30_20850 [Isosphaeraceae bacterium]
MFQPGKIVRTRGDQVKSVSFVVLVKNYDARTFEVPNAEFLRPNLSLRRRLLEITHQVIHVTEDKVSVVYCESKSFGPITQADGGAYGGDDAGQHAPKDDIGVIANGEITAMITNDKQSDPITIVLTPTDVVDEDRIA